MRANSRLENGERSRSKFMFFELGNFILSKSSRQMLVPEQNENVLRMRIMQSGETHVSSLRGLFKRSLHDVSIAGHGEQLIRGMSHILNLCVGHIV